MQPRVVVAELLAQPLPALGPPRRLVPMVDVAFHERMQVLLVGKPLPLRDALELTAFCDLIGPRPAIAEALEALAAKRYDAVADRSFKLRGTRGGHRVPAA